MKAVGIKKRIGLALQSLAIILLLCSGFSTQAQFGAHRKQASLYVAQAPASVVLRGTTDPATGTPSFEYVPYKSEHFSFQNKIATLSWHTCPALRVPPSQHNPFYLVPCIHAP